MKEGLQIFAQTYEIVGYIIDDNIKDSSKVYSSAALKINRKNNRGKAAIGISYNLKRSNECAALLWNTKYPDDNEFQIINFYPGELNEILKILGEKM